MKEITSTKNPLIKELLELKKSSIKKQKQMFLVDGEDFIFLAYEKKLLKMILTLTIMVLILSGLSLVIPLTVTSRLKAILTIIPYILVGAAIYIGMSYKIGLLNDIFGAKKIKTIINKVKSKITKK